MKFGLIHLNLLKKFTKEILIRKLNFVPSRDFEPEKLHKSSTFRQGNSIQACSLKKSHRLPYLGARSLKKSHRLPYLGACSLKKLLGYVEFTVLFYDLDCRILEF